MFLEYTLVATLLFASSYCQTNNALDELTKQAQGHLPQGFDASALNNTELKDKAIDAFHQKCLKNSDEAAYLAVKSSTDEFPTCIRGLVDENELKKEMKEAIPHGELDSVFKKYCGKTPQFKECLYAVTDKVETCLSEKERANMLVVHNITNSLADFVCHQDGDRIALFVSEGGPECFQSKSEQIRNCVNSTIGSRINTKVPFDIDDIPEFKFEKEQCVKLTQLQLCVVKELERCSQPTPANIADSLFKYIRAVTPCKEFEISKGAAVGTYFTVYNMILIAAAFFIL